MTPHHLAAPGPSTGLDNGMVFAGPRKLNDNDKKVAMEKMLFRAAVEEKIFELFANTKSLQPTSPAGRRFVNFLFPSLWAVGACWNRARSRERVFIVVPGKILSTVGTNVGKY